MIKDILLAAGGQQEQFFKPVGSAGTWISVDCSYDGNKVVTCNSGYSSSSYVYRSLDSGLSWGALAHSEISGSARSFNNVRCNYDGYRYTAGGSWFNGSRRYGAIFFDGSGGGTVDQFNSADYYALGMWAVSETGSQSSNKAVAFAFYGSVVYRVSTRDISSNVSLNYIYGGGISKSNNPKAIICSIGFEGSGGELRYCADLLANPPVFTTLTAAGTRAFYDAKVSDDGTKMAAAVYGDGVYVSTDSGASFAKKTYGTVNAIKVAMSFDGSVIAVLANLPYRLLISKDSGNTWVEKLLPNNAGLEVCLNGLGTVGYVATGAANDFIYKFNP